MDGRRLRALCPIDFSLCHLLFGFYSNSLKIFLKVPKLGALNSFVSCEEGNALLRKGTLGLHDY